MKGKMECTESCKLAFKQLKEKLMKDPVLHSPYLKKGVYSTSRFFKCKNRHGANTNYKLKGTSHSLLE